MKPTKVIYQDTPSSNEGHSNMASDKPKVSVEEENQKKEEEARAKLDDLAKKTSRILFTCKTAFPFRLFPDELSIEENRVNIIKKRFLGTKDVTTVAIQDITEVVASTTPFFSSLKIAARTFVDNVFMMEYITKADAVKARRIIEGLKMLHVEGVDTTLLESDEIVSKAEEIGKINN